MGEGVGHAPRSDSGPILAIWPDSAHTCVACTSTVALVQFINLVQWEGSHAMHVCGDLRLPWDVGLQVQVGHCKSYCGDCVEAALVAVRLELWALGAHADNDQKDCELRQGL